MTRVALIGIGMVAETHLAAIRESPIVSLVGVLGRDAKKSLAFADKLRSETGRPVRGYAGVYEIANDSEVDFVILATPPDARIDIVRTLADAGKPILMEKPIERTLAAAVRIVKQCEKANVPLGLVFQHRARDASLALKKALSDNALGRIFAAEIRVPWWRAQSYYDAPGRGTFERDGGGVLVTQAIHTLDLALWMLGPFARVQAVLRTTAMHDMEAEDWASAVFETEAGCLGTLSATTAAYPGNSETIHLHGSKATAQLKSGMLTIEFHDGRTETIGERTTTGSGADPMGFTHQWHQSVIEDFANGLKTKKPPLATGRDGLMSHAVIDACERSSAKEVWTEVNV